LPTARGSEADALTGPAAEHAVPFMRRTASRTVYANPWLSVREDEFERDDGSTGIYGVVDKQDFAIVIPEQDGMFHLVEQFRYPIGRRSWEFPMGGWPPGKGGSALELAQAELREETGLRAGRWQHLAHLYEAPGFCSQAFDIYLATELTKGAHAREDSEADMVQGDFSEAQLRQMILDGTIVDGTTITAYGLLLTAR
jgi:8-oxo-dGTP pyrophosphatase MutT (NUDIX family)